ncbi:MAG: DUF389 domain-containing protein [Bacteroidales bacterium]|nr:DUF389 domain-containing protein [Bacteroidales bacterium]
MRINIKAFLKGLGQHFNLFDDKEDEREVVRQVKEGVVFRGTNLWILIFAIFIASLGLNVNSTAVIIGAMLISPLMGPIIGLGLGVGINDYDLLRRALKNYGIATLISIATAMLYFLLSPLSEARSELLARTSPTLYDVLIAFCGGAAGVLALTTKSKGQVIPGVAIATALMPPLCTAGYGLATAQWSYFLGAFYLYFINSVFIALSTFLGVKLLRFHSAGSLSPERALYGRRVVTAVVVLTLIPAAWMTFSIVKKEVRERSVRQFVAHELVQTGTQILSSNIEHDTLRVVAVGRPISDAEVDEAQRRMADYGLKKYPLMVIQGGNTEELAMQLNDIVAASDAERRSQTQHIADLERKLEAYTQYDSLAAAVTAEAATLFPRVGEVRLGKVGDDVVAHVMVIPSGEKLDTDRVRRWLRTRLQNGDLWVEFY